MWAFGAICEEDVVNEDFGIVGERYEKVMRPPLNNFINPSDSSARNYDALYGGQHVFQDAQGVYDNEQRSILKLRNSWIAQQENNRIRSNLENIQRDLYSKTGQDIPREPISQSEVGRYYFIVDDSNPERPYIKGVQFDF